MESTVKLGPAHVSTSIPFWLTAPAYWLPTHFPTSAWRTHAPFASWLMDALRPATVAELGTHYGYSCFAFAEAAKRLGLSTTIYALDTWEGDDHAGFYGEDVFGYVESVSQADYRESVQLVRGRFDQSRPQFADKSIDLLHIDGRHGYDDVLADFTGWRSAVRDGGVVLFHDIAETENGFGVWRLWEEIAEEGRSFAFEHGHGLGVLSIGDPPEQLRPLFEADASTTQRIRDDFSRLGDTATRQAWLLSLPTELEQVRTEARARADHEAEQAARLDAQQSRIDALEASTSWRLTSPLRALGKLRPRLR